VKITYALRYFLKPLKTQPLWGKAKIRGLIKMPNHSKVDDGLPARDNVMTQLQTSALAPNCANSDNPNTVQYSMMRRLFFDLRRQRRRIKPHPGQNHRLTVHKKAHYLEL
jgi:hypothetical protein